MKVTLINEPTLGFVDSAIGQCWDKGSYDCDTNKGKERIERICNKLKHSSMLRFVNYIFEVELSTSALLEWSRHQVGVDYAVKSTRYCTKQNPNNIKIELSLDDDINELLIKHTNEIITFIKDNPNKSNDDLKLLLPQAFIYKMQVQFNAQSLQHFLKLRTNKSSHYHIRELAYALYNKVPNNHKYLFEDYVYEDKDYGRTMD